MSPIGADILPLKVGYRILCRSALDHHPAAELFESLQIPVTGLSGKPSPIPVTAAEVCQTTLYFGPSDIRPHTETTAFNHHGGSTVYLLCLPFRGSLREHVGPILFEMFRQRTSELLVFLGRVSAADPFRLSFQLCRPLLRGLLVLEPRNALHHAMRVFVLDVILPCLQDDLGAVLRDGRNHHPPLRALEPGKSLPLASDDFCPLRERFGVRLFEHSCHMALLQDLPGFVVVSLLPGFVETSLSPRCCASFEAVASVIPRLRLMNRLRVAWGTPALTAMWFACSPLSTMASRIWFSRSTGPSWRLHLAFLFIATPFYWPLQYIATANPYGSCRRDRGGSGAAWCIWALPLFHTPRSGPLRSSCRMKAGLTARGDCLSSRSTACGRESPPPSTPGSPRRARSHASCRSAAPVESSLRCPTVAPSVRYSTRSSPALSPIPFDMAASFQPHLHPSRSKISPPGPPALALHITFSGLTEPDVLRSP